MSAALWLIPVGLVTGLLSGLFGVGGGFLIVPLLSLLGWPLHVAIGTSLLYVTGLGLGGSVSHARAGNLDARLIVAMAAPAIAGAQLGALGTATMPAWLTHAVFALCTVVAAIQMGAPEAPDRPRAERWAPAWAAALGIVVGVLSGFLGVGGGLFLVPGQVRWLGVPLKRAIGNSMAVIVLTGASGVVGHVVLGHVSWPVIPWLMVAGVAGMQAGLLLSARLPLVRLRQAFIGVMVLVAAWMGCQSLYALAGPYHASAGGTGHAAILFDASP